MVEKQISFEGNRPLLIGVCGGTASGKTSLCRRVIERINMNCVILTFDHFYSGLSEEEHEDAENYNFDHPNALDFDECYDAL